MLLSDGKLQQQGWQCESVTGRAPDLDAFDDAHRAALEAVRRLTGAKCVTCPNWLARMPWVHDAVNARRWRDAGALRERVGWPSAALVAAIDLIDRADNARERDDYEREKAERERERLQREANRDG